MDEALADTEAFLGQKAVSAGLTLAIPTAPKDLVLEADRRTVHQVLLNVLANALKFTPTGGRVSVRLRRDVPGRLGIEIADTGCGIPADQLARVVEPWVQGTSQGREPGTGIGLPLAGRFMELQGGSLELESVVGQGTTVRLWFPLPPGPTADAATQPGSRVEATPVLRAVPLPTLGAAVRPA